MARLRATNGGSHPSEPHTGTLSDRLNWLRAGVLGANDGIVSVAGIVAGVAGATSARAPVLTAGLAGLLAGALSMALGEYVSVSSQRDTERALVAKEQGELEQMPEAELAELAGLYRAKGLSEQTAQAVAEELTRRDALAAHSEIELGVAPGHYTNPWQAAAASAAAFTIGAVLPLIAILAPPASWRVPIMFVTVLAALALTGDISARLGQSDRRRAILRVVIGGGLAMIITYGIGRLIGVVTG
jgi:vacuolar iron transporter family protein